MPLKVRKLPNKNQWIVSDNGKRVGGPFRNKEKAEAKKQKIQSAIAVSRKAASEAYQESSQGSLDPVALSRKFQNMMNRRTSAFIRQDMEDLAEQWKLGRLLKGEFVSQMAELVAELQMALAAEEYGTITDADMPAIISQLEKQFGISLDGGGLMSMGDWLESDKYSDAQFDNRINMYMSDATHGKYAIARERSNKPYEVRVMSSTAEHCSCCPEYAAMGLQPKGHLPLPGEKCECGPNCKCQLLQLTLEEAIARGYA